MVHASNPLATLAQTIVQMPSMAGEYQHLVRDSGPLRHLTYMQDIRWWLEPAIFADVHGPPGTGKSYTLSALLRATRRRELSERIVQSREDLVATIASTYDTAWRDKGVLGLTVPPVAKLRAAVQLAPFSKGRTLLPLVLASGSSTLTTPVRAATDVVSSLRPLGPADVVWAALQADLVYWRTVTAELRRLLSAPVAPPPEPDVVVLDSSPCGIRRLTAVRVPRAPGSERTSPTPNSSWLAAA